MQFALAPQLPGILGAFPHHLAAVEDNGLEAHFGQDQPSEQAAWPGSDHDGPQALVFGRDRNRAIGDVWRGLNVHVVLETGQQHGLVPDLDVENIDLQDRGLPTCVMRPLPDRPGNDITRRHAQAGSDRGGQGLLRVIERQLEF
ncbi:hypothetical protein D3C81_1741330 [compost metagenome]